MTLPLQSRVRLHRLHLSHVYTHRARHRGPCQPTHLPIRSGSPQALLLFVYKLFSYKTPYYTFRKWSASKSLVGIFLVSFMSRIEFRASQTALALKSLTQVIHSVCGLRVLSGFDSVYPPVTSSTGNGNRQSCTRREARTNAGTNCLSVASEKTTKVKPKSANISKEHDKHECHLSHARQSILSNQLWTRSNLFQGVEKVGVIGDQTGGSRNLCKV